MRGGFRSPARRISSGRFSANDEIVKCVLDELAPVRRAPEPLCVAFVLREEQIARAVTVESILASRIPARFDHGKMASGVPASAQSRPPYMPSPTPRIARAKRRRRAHR